MENDRNLLMLNSVNTAIAVFANDFSCIDCNRFALEMFCFKDKAEYIDGFYRTMPPFQANGVPSVLFFKKLLSDAFESGKACSEIICRQIDGILVSADVTLQRVQHGDTPVVIGSFYNLSEIKLAMKKAVSASEIAQLYLSAAPLAMELFNDQYRILDCNQQALELLGFSNKTEYLKRNTPEAPDYLYHDIYTLAQDEKNYYKALSDGFTRYEWVFQTEDGGKLLCEITRVRITGVDRIFVVSYINDLSTLKSMATELKKAEAIERENRAKNHFLAQMSHILLTPLNTITGLTEIELQKNNPPETKETFVKIRRSSETLLRIINDIFELSNANSGNLTVSYTQIDAVSLIVDIMLKAVVEWESDEVRLELHVDESLPSMLFGDAIRIKQITNRLLSNAFKFTKAGIVTLHFYTEPASEGHDLTLVITVSDTGHGMTQMQAENLFDIKRYNEQGTIQGMGLGVAVTNSLVQMMNGTMDVVSEKDIGSTFSVRLPMRSGGGAMLGAEIAKILQNIETARNALKQKKSIEYETMPYGKVLVVDDVESNLHVAMGLMKLYGLKVDTATSGLEAFKKIKEGAEYDIIFMDHMMPDMDGIQTAKAIMALGCKFPIIALTANILMGQVELFEGNGFAGFLSKPIDVNQLNDCLLRFIRDKYPEEAKAARAAAPITTAPETGISDELAKHFMRDAKNASVTLEALLPNLSQNDLKLYIITAHGIKSALANVNELKLSETAAALEAAGCGGDLQTISTQTPPFISHLKNVIVSFEQKLNTHTNNQAEDNPILLKEQLTLLITACDNYNKPAAKKALTTLKQGQCSQKVLQLLDEISVLLLHGEFEKAADLAGNAIIVA